MLCYIFTPFVNRYYEKVCNYLALKESAGGQTISLVVAVILMAFLLQILTIPLAIAFKFKSAWISLYMFAFFYAKLYDTNKKVEILDKVILMISVAGILIRIWANDTQVVGLTENLLDLCIQYITCVQGAAIFIALRRLCMGFKIFQQKRSRKIVLYICGISYEIYIVQGFFCDGIYTSKLCGSYIVNSAIILTVVLLSAKALSHLRRAMAKFVDKWRN